MPGGAVPPRTLPIGITRSDPAPWEELPAGLSSLPYDETVYVTLGTVVNKRDGALARLLASVSELEANVVMTVGPDVDVLQFGPVPDNVLLERWVPQALLLPHCVAMVSHAGAGTMLGGLAAGLPSLLVPLGADQFFNAAAAAAAGAARVMELGDVSAEAIAAVMADARVAVRRGACRGRAGGDAVALRGARRGAPRGCPLRRPGLTGDQDASGTAPSRNGGIIASSQSARSMTPSPGGNKWVVPGSTASCDAGGPENSPMIPPPRRRNSSTACSSRTMSESPTTISVGAAIAADVLLGPGERRR